MVIFRGIYFPMIVWKLAFSISFFFIFKLSEIIGCQDAHIFQENLSPPAGKIYIDLNGTPHYNLLKERKSQETVKLEFDDSV